MMHANKQALQFINKSNQHNKCQTAGKELVIPIGNHILLWDHLEGHNKIQNRFKSDVYIMVSHHDEPNVYYIKLLNSDKKALPKGVNRCQLFDLNQSVPPSVGSLNAANGLASVPLFLYSNRSDTGLISNLDLNSSINFDSATGTDTHHYNARSKHKATTAGRHVVAETIVTCL